MKRKTRKVATATHCNLKTVSVVLGECLYHWYVTARCDWPL